MDKPTLEKMAVTAFENLQATRDALYNAAENVIQTKADFETQKADLSLSGKLDGKNAELREAQARTFLMDAFEAVAIVERSERGARYRFDKASIDVDTVKTLLRIAELV